MFQKLFQLWDVPWKVQVFHLRFTQKSDPLFDSKLSVGNWERELDPENFWEFWKCQCKNLSKKGWKATCLCFSYPHTGLNLTSSTGTVNGLAHSLTFSSVNGENQEWLCWSIPLSSFQYPTSAGAVQEASVMVYSVKHCWALCSFHLICCNFVFLSSYMSM